MVSTSIILRRKRYRSTQPWVISHSYSCSPLPRYKNGNLYKNFIQLVALIIMHINSLSPRKLFSVTLHTVIWKKCNHKVSTRKTNLSAERFRHFCHTHPKNYQNRYKYYKTKQNSASKRRPFYIQTYLQLKPVKIKEVIYNTTARTVILHFKLLYTGFN